MKAICLGDSGSQLQNMKHKLFLPQLNKCISTIVTEHFKWRRVFFCSIKPSEEGSSCSIKLQLYRDPYCFFSTGCQLVQCAIQWGWMETEQNVLQMDSWLFYYFHVANLPQHHVCSCGSWWTQKFQVQMKTKASSTDRKIEGKAFAPPAHILACFSKVLTLLKAMSSTKQPKMQSRQVESSEDDDFSENKIWKSFYNFLKLLNGWQVLRTQGTCLFFLFFCFFLVSQT